MKRLLLDTCIYGELIIDKDIELIKQSSHKQKIVIYGLSFIRKELRATSKTKQYQGKKLRLDLLSLYDELVKDKTLNVEEELARSIAKKYYQAYRQCGGNYSEQELLADYLIVACAALKGMDIVVSNDHATMLSDNSLRAYSLVNTTAQLQKPKFVDYQEFKAFLLKGSGGGWYGSG